MPDLTPTTWTNAANAVVTNMAHWGTVDRSPVVLLGDPKGDLSRCGCEGDGTPKGGQVLITAGEVYFTGDQFPEQDVQRRKFGPNCPDRWAVPITVEFARCRPVFAADGRSQPSPAVINTHAAYLYADAWAIWTALRCAQPVWNSALGSSMVRGWGPILRDLGPCGGFAFNIVGEVKVCEPCP